MRDEQAVGEYIPARFKGLLIDLISYALTARRRGRVSPSRVAPETDWVCEPHHCDDGDGQGSVPDGREELAELRGCFELRDRVKLLER